MRIETNTGKTFPITMISTSIRDRNKLLIEVKDERSLAEIAQDFDGLTSIRKTADDAPEGVYEMFEGFSVLTSVQHDRSLNVVRIVLEKSA